MKDFLIKKDPFPTIPCEESYSPSVQTLLIPFYPTRRIISPVMPLMLATNGDVLVVIKFMKVRLEEQSD